MSAEENKAVVRRLREAWNTRNWAVLEELVVPDYIDHNPLLGAKPGRQGYREKFLSFTNAFPDFEISSEDTFAEGGKVVSRLTLSGTHRAEFIGIAPTNKRVTIAGIVIYRIVSGKLVEEWSNIDLLELFQQLGLIPPLRLGGE